jgi:hypothetical protein
MTEIELQRENIRLKKENEELKDIIREGKNTFGVLMNVVDLKKAAEGGMMAFQLPKIMMTITKNPELVDKIGSYINKVNSLDI